MGQVGDIGARHTAQMSTGTPEEAVDEAIRSTPRANFLPRAMRRHADQDRPLPIGHGQTNSQPSTVRRMLEILDVGRGQRVLDVGSGSGWTTVLLARLVGPDGSVIGVEIEPSLVEQGRRNVAGAGLPWARVMLAEPGRIGWPQDAPYDRILVSAMGTQLADELVAQLSDSGTLAAPVAGTLLRLRRHHGAEPTVERFGSYRFVPLR